MDSSSTYRHFWLVLSLCAGIVASMAISGCKTGMLSNAHFPKLGMQNGPFKMLAKKNKDQPAPPPSRHFDDGNAKNSSDADARVVVSEPDINAVAALDSSKPSQKRSPTQPESGNPSGGASGFGFPPNSDSIAKNNSPGDSPIRKPYQSPGIPGDSLKSAAEALARDIDKPSMDSRNRLDSATQDSAKSLANAESLANSIRGSTSDFGSRVAKSTNQSGSQFTPPDTKPQSPPAGDNAEKQKFGFSVPPTPKFDNVPGSSQPYQSPNGQAQATIQNLNPMPKSPDGTSGFTMPESSVTLTPLQPRPPAPEAGGSNAYPSTPHGQYITTPQGTTPEGNAPPANTWATNPNSEKAVPNSRWSNVIPSDTPPFGSNSAQSGLANSFGLPEALLQRSGSYAPGSTRAAATPSENSWR